MPSPSTRQAASAFNQPLSLDTSSVTTMYAMFDVRSARALGPQALSRAFSPCMPLVVPPPHHTGPPACRLPLLSPPASHALPSTGAGRVDLQPAAELRHLQRHDHGLHVRCALRACPWPQALSRAFSLCMPLVCRHHTTGPPACRLPLLSPPIACPPFDSAEREGLQPAAELRHLQRHDHARNVLRALRACPWPPSLESGLSRACLLCATSTPGPPAFRLAPLPPASHALPSTRQGASASTTAAELRHLQRHRHELHVLRALPARALGPQALSRAFSPCMPLVCRHHTTGPPAFRLAHLSPRIACAPFDSAVRVGLQPAAEL